MLDFFNLFITLFASIGIIYTFLDLYNYLMRKKKKAHCILLLSLPLDKYESTATLLNVVKFYHSSRAERYIEKIVLTDYPDEFFKEKDALKNALDIPLEFKEKIKD